MVSNFPRLIVAPEPSTPHRVAPASQEWFGERVLDLIREAFCGLHGHDNMLRFEHDRLCLKCVSCGHESPGWELKDTPAAPANNVGKVADVAHESRPQPLPRPQIVGARRIA